MKIEQLHTGMIVWDVRTVAGSGGFSTQRISEVLIVHVDHGTNSGVVLARRDGGRHANYAYSTWSRWKLDKPVLLSTDQYGNQRYGTPKRKGK